MNPEPLSEPSIAQSCMHLGVKGNNDPCYGHRYVALFIVSFLTVDTKQSDKNAVAQSSLRSRENASRQDNLCTDVAEHL